MSTKNYNILIVDDDPEFHQQIRYAFRRNYVFEGAINIEHLHKKLQEKAEFDLILMDLVLDDSEEKKGLDLILKVKEQHPRIPIIVVTADREIDTVVRAMKIGAKDFLPKGDYDFEFWNQKFIEIIEGSKLKAENQQLKAEVKRRRDQESKEYTFIGESTNIQDIKRMLRLVSDEPDITVLILGETGVGKEVAARFLHQHGARQDQPFQAVNLSAIQETLLESTLFGHKKGAFTGATRDMEGYFRQANGGILMLDEIGDINADIQIKLLRFLETKLIRPVGADQDVLLDVQIIAATHRNLQEEVEKGNFRADLYQRLKAMVVEIPPLRERKSDIPLIMQHYLGETQMRDLLTPGAIDMLLAYNWVGNIRELKNTINYMLLRKKIYEKDMIDQECLPSEIQNYQPTAQPIATTNAAPAAGKALTMDEEHALIDLRKIEESLIRKNKVKKDVAVELGLENTDNLRYKIKKYYDKHPHLFDAFPLIKESYKKIIKD